VHWPASMRARCSAGGLARACSAGMPVNPAARVWLDTVANVRIHGETHRPPVDLFQEERSKLQPLNPMPYDLARLITTRGFWPHWA
jgi:hypothetical protein